MKTIKHIIFALILAIIQYLLVSCEKLIEVDLPENQIGSEQVFEDVGTANSALAGLYAGLWDNSPLAGDQSGSLLSIYTDEMDFFALNSNPGMAEIFQNQQIDSNNSIANYWANAYQKIYQANAIIEGSEKSSSLPATDKNRIIGEALLVRSVLYYYLNQLFGDIPYVISTDYQINKNISKTNASELLTKLENDVRNVLSLLTDQYRSSERVIPNRKVAQLVLAKILVLEKKYTDAEILLKQINSSSLYQFQPDILKVFKKDNNGILWQLKPLNQGQATKESVLYFFSNTAPPSYALSSTLINSFAQNDFRKQQWIAQVSVGGQTWYRAEKYKNKTDNVDEYSVVFRLEEAYLLLAEVLARQGKIDEALPFLNATRLRAGLNPITQPITQQNFLNEILMENNREFFTEMGHRFFDLKKAEKLDLLISSKPNWKNFHQKWPLPQKELLLNSNLKPQNSGY
ncbi:RagB/SusD family nutrient uptake outer membrane protein [Chryseobacterium sp. WG23]|uniref:RagB/SusD family nutrient uptake outer membrane protein n=1 Tax=Chryseobacterium sp. WG23 TaxID=2926910 RepID=UPI00211E0FCC|nr:RagB/SusD family nutrient uptake outer membrane protein [Chryseobacterium sp. WG23]MCQ9634169.1 RagB/SusD family nutrient uptake outer membrane protein [Chryseobacterium sp. WG23]